MAELSLMIDAEYENIDKTLVKMPSVDKLAVLSEIELAGAATFLHNFYNGIENILKRCLIDMNVRIPQSGSWHKELLELAFSHNIISEDMKVALIDYLYFRHFFVHAYALDLYSNKMEPLVGNITSTYNQF